MCRQPSSHGTSTNASVVTKSNVEESSPPLMKKVKAGLPLRNLTLLFWTDLILSMFFVHCTPGESFMSFDHLYKQVEGNMFITTP